MGDRFPLNPPVTLHIRLPRAARLRLIRNGDVVRTWSHTTAVDTVVDRPGAYRVEAYLRVWGRDRGWIFSNPIYLD